jgi:hypothetical protein
MSISPNDFGVSFKGFLEQMSAAAPAEDPVFHHEVHKEIEVIIDLYFASLRLFG